MTVEEIVEELFATVLGECWKHVHERVDALERRVKELEEDTYGRRTEGA